jgi:hypothetical protein
VSTTVGNAARLVPLLLCALVGRWREGMHNDRVAGRLLGLLDIGNRLTHLGRETLAGELLRAFAGPVVAVPTWLGSPMSDDEAVIMLALIAGRDPYLVKVNKLVSVHLDAMWRKCWIDAYDRPGSRGRDALAAYLLRGWRP